MKEDLAGVLSEYSCRLWVINQLGLKEDRQAIGDIDAPFIECGDVGAALDLAREWRGVAFTFIVDAIGHNMTFNLWSERGTTNLCLYLAREIVWYVSEEYEEGEWLLKFLLRLVAALHGDCCGYGRDRDYDVIYQPLNPDRLISRLGDGSLVAIPSPVIHLISASLLGSEGIGALINRHEVPPGFRHRESTAGYHMLWNFR
jgi:hypothetical protein